MKVAREAYGTIAQLVEHRVEAAGVGGSNPSSSTKGDEANQVKALV